MSNLFTNILLCPAEEIGTYQALNKTAEWYRKCQPAGAHWREYNRK